MRKVTQIEKIIECETEIVAAQIQLQRTPEAEERDEQLDIILGELELQKQIKKEGK